MLRGVIVNVAQIISDTKPAVTTLVPTSGQTVSFNSTTQDQVLWLSPAGTLATLTVNFPSDASTKLGQEVRLGTSQSITSLTLAGATMIYNSAATLAAGEMAEYLKVASNTWVRL